MSTLFNMQLENITLQMINELLQNQSYENKFLDFKESFPSFENNDSKNNFLKDISAFANTEGGDIIFGIKENNGIASEIVGVDNAIIDDTKLRMENLIRDNIEPNNIKYDFKIIPLHDINSIVIIRVYKSYSKPHYIIFRLKDRERFYLRTASGNSPMSYTEIKNTFLHTDSLFDKIKNHRKDRINDIINKETDIIIEGKSYMTLHLTSLNLNSYINNTLNLENIKNSSLNIKEYTNTFGSFNYERYSLNGFLRYGGGQYDNMAKRYVLFFRNSNIEYLTSDVFYKEQYIGNIVYEKDIINITKQLIEYYKFNNILPPIIIQLSFINVKNYVLDINRNAYWNGLKNSLPIDKEILLLPEIILEDYSINIEHFLRPLFDMVWNTFGYPKCINYDENGNWYNSNH